MALTQFCSRLIADVGISMGDEGKGRLIPEVIAELQQTTGLEDPVAVVLKVNGGANSGHTAGGLKLNLLPAGVIAGSVPLLALGSGVVADPRKLLWEAKPLQQRGLRIFERLAIDERCMVSDLSHRLLDLAWEHYRAHVLGDEPRGSTGRGITPAYLDEVGQFQLFYGDLAADAAGLRDQLAPRFDRALAVIRHVCQVPADVFAGFFDTLTQAELRANQASVEAGIFPSETFDFTRFRGAEPFAVDLGAVAEAYAEAIAATRANIADVRERIFDEMTRGRYLIGEFGQSYWLDKRHGFPPNVTASHTYTPELFQSAGLPAQPVHTMGVCKAYDTKVGTHVFLTQMDNAAPLTQKLLKLEFGTSTGRQRMVGWFDAVEKGDALRYGGFQDLVLNKLDALSADHGGESTLQVCYAYENRAGERVYRVPRNDHERRTLRPIYAELPGWTDDLSGVRSFEDLPANAQRYVAFCVKATIDVATRRGHTLTSPNLRYIGVGPDPAQIITDVPATEALMRLA
ncbi:MAG: adenylosuccinate synthetase [Opitutales bacterium]